MKKAEIMYQDRTAGWLVQDEEGYHFVYDKTYLESMDPKAISIQTTHFGKISSNQSVRLSVDLHEMLRIGVIVVFICSLG